MNCLQAVAQLGLKDAWISVGLLRNTVWDILTETTTSINDIDVIYFDSSDISMEAEKLLEEKLKNILPNQPWSVKNQARMHHKSGFSPFKSSNDGVAHFPETPTAVAARIYNEELEIMAPYGLKDLFEMQVKPTPYYKKEAEQHLIYVERLQKKNWSQTWEKLSVEIE